MTTSITACADDDTLTVVVERLEEVKEIVVEKCNSPCIGDPCQNGRCVPHLNGVNYQCECLDGWIGDHCDIGECFTLLV